MTDAKTILGIYERNLARTEIQVLKYKENVMQLDFEKIIEAMANEICALVVFAPGEEFVMLTSRQIAEVALKAMARELPSPSDITHNTNATSYCELALSFAETWRELKEFGNGNS